MKDRIFKVLMIMAGLSGIGWAIGSIFISITEEPLVVVAIPFGVIPVIVASTIQYIIYGEYHPMYLFRK